MNRTKLIEMIKNVRDNMLSDSQLETSVDDFLRKGDFEDYQESIKEFGFI